MQADVAVPRMVEAIRDGRKHLEANRPIWSDGRAVRLGHRVEEHRAVPLASRPIECVLDERPPDPLTPVAGIDHEVGAGDMRCGAPQFGCMFAVPTTLLSSSTATTVRLGGTSSHVVRASSSVSARP